ncbi:MAG TPA: glycoside hydrolase family 71/99-like protein [Fimbriimonas sp.]|nr:glycoside hydrolase family 71/99-like protein [Fimbriimonas sp.]
MLTLLAAAALARPLVMAHYMPWYESKPTGGHWGWHWTMNHFHPDKGQIASRYSPIIGPYDSSDPEALEYETLEMKVSGIDGVFIDWYGTKDLYDYPLINRNTQKMIEACTKARLKFAIVLEDQVVPNLVKNGKSTPEEFGRSVSKWLETRWFQRRDYLRWQNKPVLLIFGPQYYKTTDLRRFFGSTALFTLLGRKEPAVGGYGWPEPQVGDSRSWTQVRAFYERAKQWPASIPVAYPRFEDIYKAAGIGSGYGKIRDAGGATFDRTLSMAIRSHAPFIQIATWNDWGEGTQIEPSKEFGYRDLERLQAQRRKLDPSFPYRRTDLRVPERIYRLRKRHASPSKLDQARRALMLGQGSRAERILASLVRGLNAPDRSRR